MSGHGFDPACQHCLQWRRKARRLGLPCPPVRVDAGRAHDHLRRLTEQGFSCRDIAAAAGLHRSTLLKLGHRDTILVETERKLLAVHPQQLLGHFQDATASRLRWQALNALGYSNRWIAEQIGVVRWMRSQRVTTERALRLLALCRRIGDTRGPSEDVATLARDSEWRVPADYDEELFYSPFWDGTEPLIEMGSQSQMRAWAEEYDFLTGIIGLSYDATVARLGITPTYMQRILRRRAEGRHPFGRPSEPWVKSA